MANFINQNVKVNFIDVDTQFVVLKNFTLYIGILGTNILIRGGSDEISIGRIYSGEDNKIEFGLPGLTGMGYELAYADGNKFNVKYDNDFESYVLPGVINIYLRKIA
ncbi:MAG: hypothetical protein ACK5KL_04225 [Dysgonomonas sp.]|jgi:hypothetical protein|nr:hypothetical protein [Prevotella sp.]